MGKVKVDRLTKRIKSHVRVVEGGTLLLSGGKVPINSRSKWPRIRVN